MPLVARDLLHGGAQTYGIMLGAFAWAPCSRAQYRRGAQTNERRSRGARLRDIDGRCDRRGGAQHQCGFDCGSALLAGGVWMLAVALFNIGVQLSAPRWVAGRSLAAFQASIAAASRLEAGAGSSHRLCRGRNRIAGFRGPDAGSPVLGIWLRMPPIGARNEAATEVLADPEVRLSLTGRSGPLVVEIEYRVAQDSAGCSTM